MLCSLLGGMIEGAFPIYSVFLMKGSLLLATKGLMYLYKEKGKNNAFNK